MKKFFTSKEKNIIIFLFGFLFLGIIVLNSKKIIDSNTEDTELRDSLKKAVQKKRKPAHININESDIETLSELPGVGPVTAKRIFDYRETHGKFSSILELDKVKGIGKKTLAKLIPHLEIIGDSSLVKNFKRNQESPQKTKSSSEIISHSGKINLNTASKQELKTLYRVGEVTATRIINYRDTMGKFSSIDEIKQVKGIGTGIFEKIQDKIKVHDE